MFYRKGRQGAELSASEEPLPFCRNYRQAGVTLIKLFFGLARLRGFIRRHDGLREAIGANATTISEAGDGRGEAPSNHQDDSKSRPDQGDFANGSKILRRG